MAYLFLKALISGIIVAIVSEISKRYPGAGALVASLPLVSVLGMIWLWRDKPDVQNMAELADHAGDRGFRGECRAHQMGATTAALTAFEVAVRGRGATFTG
jgi:hypothetical protein